MRPEKKDNPIWGALFGRGRSSERPIRDALFAHKDIPVGREASTAHTREKSRREMKALYEERGDDWWY